MTKESFMEMLETYMTSHSESELSEKMTIEKAVAFWRLAVWFSKNSSKELAAEKIGKIHDLFLKCAEKDHKYYFWSAECSMLMDMNFKSNSPFERTVGEYEQFSKNCRKIRFRDVTGKDKMNKNFIMLKYGMDDLWEQEWGGIFCNVHIYTRYMMYHCYDKMGDRFFRDGLKNNDNDSLCEAFDCYIEAVKCLKFLESNGKLAQNDTFFFNEFHFLCSLTYGKLLEVSYFIEETETAQMCFNTLLSKKCYLSDKYYKYMFRLFVREGRPDRAEDSLKLGYMKKLDVIKSYKQNINCRNDVLKKYKHELREFVSLINRYFGKTELQILEDIFFTTNKKTERVFFGDADMTEVV